MLGLTYLKDDFCVSQGDSGGPMSIGNTVYGITSWIASGCLSNYPSVYAKVGVFYDWICTETGDQATGC